MFGIGTFGIALVSVLAGLGLFLSLAAYTQGKLNDVQIARFLYVVGGYALTAFFVAFIASELDSNGWRIAIPLSVLALTLVNWKLEIIRWVEKPAVSVYMHERPFLD